MIYSLAIVQNNGYTMDVYITCVYSVYHTQFTIFYYYYFDIRPERRSPFRLALEAAA